MRFRRAAVAACGVMSLTAVDWPRAAQGPDSDTLDRLAPAVVQVLSSGCRAPGDRVATGFVWKSYTQVVTDLHAVLGCDKIVLKYSGLPAGQSGIATAEVANILLDEDLVLLKVTGAPKVEPLSATDRAPEPDEWLKVFGYPLGVPVARDALLRVSDINRKHPELSASLDEKARQDLQKNRFPKLDAQVLQLEGPLLPGHSGAPVLDAQGRVVGIGSGGLERGAASIGWAMRAGYLAQLETAHDSVPAGSAGITAEHFAVVSLQDAETDEASPEPGSGTPASATAPASLPDPAPVPPQSVAPSGSPRGKPEAPVATVAVPKPVPAPQRGSVHAVRQVKCGGLSLVFLRTRTLRELMQAAEDPQATVRFARQFLAVDDVLGAYGAALFEIWTEPGSGAAIVVPKGARLEQGESFCTLRTRVPAMYDVIRLAPLPADEATPEWEYAVGAERWESLGHLSRGAGTGLVWGKPQRGWSGTHTVNGGTVRRQVMVGAGKSSVRILRADMGGRGAYVLIGAVDRSVDTSDSDLERDVRVRNLLAVSLSTFPPRIVEPPSAPDSAVGVAAHTESDPEDGPGDDTVERARAYPRIGCGFALLRLTPTQRAGDLLAASADRADIAARLKEAGEDADTDWSAEAIGTWGMSNNRSLVQLPADLVLVDRSDASGTAGAPPSGYCSAADPVVPTLRYVVMGINATLRKFRNGGADDAFRAALAADTGLRLSERDAAGSTADAERGVATRSLAGSSSDGQAVHAWERMIARAGIVTYVAVVDTAPGDPARTASQRGRVAAALAGLHLSGLQP